MATCWKPLAIDATLAGRAFATITVQEADSGAGRRLWLPLLDGAEGLGVLGLTLPSMDDPLRKRCSWLAILVAEMILSKDQYTDTYSMVADGAVVGVVRTRTTASSPSGRCVAAESSKQGPDLEKMWLMEVRVRWRCA